MSVALTNVIQFSQVMELVQSFVKNPPKKGCLGLIGAPGIGKTQGVEEGVAAAGKDESYVCCPLFTPGDVVGAAFPSDDMKRTVFLPSDVLNEAHVLVFDELPNADQQFQNIANRVLLDGELNGRHFPEARIFMGNPTSCSSMAVPLPEILVSKSVLVMVDYRFKDFLSYAMGATQRNIHPIVASFIHETQDRYLQVKDYTVMKHGGVATPDVGSPFPTPRSYELLSALLYRIERDGLSLSAFDAAYATIGSEAGKAFGDHACTATYLPKISKILSGSAERFPDKALVGGVALMPLQMMALFGIIGAASNPAEFRHGVEWIFAQFEDKTVSRELVRAFWANAMTSHHAGYAAAVIQGYAKKSMGAVEFVAWIKDTMMAGQEAASF